MGVADMSLYAQWAYTVTYEGNGSTGGSAPIDTNVYEQGEAVTVLSNSGLFVQDGYSFVGWNTAADGTGTSYAPGVTFAIGAASVTLNAQWNAITYFVHYDGNGYDTGSVPGASSGTIGTLVAAATAGNLSKAGHDFSGWNTAPDGSGTTYAAGTTLEFGSSDVTLYAHWSPVTYYFSYSGNGNTSGTAPATTSGTIGTSVTIYGVGTLARTGYAFEGWNTASDGSGTAYASGQSFIIGSSDVTLYAQWSLVTYYISYNGNGNTTGSAPSTASGTIGAEVTVANAGDLARTGYTFVGWNTAPDGTGTAYASGGLITIGSNDDVLYAQWTEPTSGFPDVSFGVDGGVLISSGTNNDGGTSVAIDDNGRIVVAGYSNNEFAVARVGADGTPDSSFGTNGLVTSDFASAASKATDVAIDSNGKIVVAGNVGSRSNSDFGVIRYLSNGNPDDTFGTLGRVTVDFFSNEDKAGGIAVDTNGKIVIAGASRNASYQYFVSVARLNVDGSLDSTFDGDGLLTYSADSGADGYDVGIDSAGRIVVSGRAAFEWGYTYSLVVRFNSDGSLESRFPTAYGNGFESTGNALTFDSSGRIIVVGSGQDWEDYDSLYYVFRYGSDGTFDPSFNSSGGHELTIGAAYSYALGVAVDGFGRIVTIGYDSSGVVVVRFADNGTLDTNFGIGGIARPSFGSAAGVAVDSSDNIYYVGTANNGTDNDILIVKILP